MSFYQEYLRKKEEEKKKSLNRGMGNSNSITEEEIEKVPSVNSVEEKIAEDVVPENIPKPEEVPPAIPVRNNVQSTEGKISELQKKEEEERQEFLKRVKGEDSPLDIREKETPIIEDISIQLPQRPPKGEKVLIRIIIVLALALAVATVSLFWYRTVQNKEPGPSEIIKDIETVEIIVSEVIAPQSFFSYDFFKYPVITRDNEISSHLFQYMREINEEEALIKLMFRDQRDERNPRFISARTFLNTFSVAMPSPFNDRVDQDSFNLFIHSRNGENNVGFAVIINDNDGFSGMMREWETNAQRDLSGFLSFLGKSSQATMSLFVPSTHRANIIRCQEYNDGSRVCYSLLSEEGTDIFIFTTSLESMGVAIDSLL